MHMIFLELYSFDWTACLVLFFLEKGTQQLNIQITTAFALTRGAIISNVFTFSWLIKVCIIIFAVLIVHVSHKLTD